ncbi:hypothetical protein QNF05_004727 [Vibrio alginolyticus]|nr:hypothetical protein [Vibrio alginolyticus]
MKNKLELLGYRFEITGLVFAVLAVVWQANFSGWWDTERFEWQYSIQEEANLAVLGTLKDIALLQAIDDKEELKKELAVYLKKLTMQFGKLSQKDCKEINDSKSKQTFSQ